jgi:ribosomal-protein-alanine N-acetyltransferase
MSDTPQHATGEAPAITLRPYRTGDLDAMWRLDVECFERAFRFSRSTMRSFAEAPQAVVVIAECNQQLAGFAIAEVADTAGYIVTLDVASQWRHRGLGRQILRDLEQRAHANGAEMILLHVYTRNAAAVRLYESLHYRRTGLAQAFYARGLDAFTYEKQL